MMGKLKFRSQAKHAIARKIKSRRTDGRTPHPVWPIRLVCSLQLDRAQTFTSLSHPADTITGADGEGENRTHETHSV